MDYKEAVDYLFSRLPVFQNIGARAFKPGLHTTEELCKSLGDPQNKYPTIHVGGTNGKGSTSHMLAAILQKAGYKVGLYTSPHLKSFTERIKINGESVEEAFVAKFVDANKSNIDKFSPSFFEVTVALAFSYFADNKVDIAVIEVGMGGRLDSTNIITPILALITNVSYDHVQFLGDTLPKIAFEKAGIIKNGVPAIVSEYQNWEVSAVFENAAKLNNTNVTYGSEVYSVRSSKIENGLLHMQIEDLSDEKGDIFEVRLDLTGSYQEHNIKGVLTAVSDLRKAGYIIKNEHLFAGLSAVSEITGLKGRWQVIGESPFVVCDTAHNAAGLAFTIAQFLSMPAATKRFVIGFVADKDVSNVLKLFPTHAIYYFCQPNNLRALESEKLREEAELYGLVGNAYSNVNEALEAAKRDSIATDSIYVGGSTFVVADLNEL